MLKLKIDKPRDLEKNYDTVKSMMSSATIYVYEENNLEKKLIK